MKPARKKETPSKSSTRESVSAAHSETTHVVTNNQQQQRQKPPTFARKGETSTAATTTNKTSRLKEQTTRDKNRTKQSSNVIESHHHHRQQQQQISRTTRAMPKTNRTPTTTTRRQHLLKDASSEETSSSSQEMTTATSASSLRSDVTLTPMHGGNIVSEQETNLDRVGGNNTDEDECTTLLESPIQSGFVPMNDRRSDLSQQEGKSLHSTQAERVLYHDYDEINYDEPTATSTVRLVFHTKKESTEEDDEVDYEETEELSKGAALTMADDDQLTTIHSEEISFVVYPLGCCDFDETQLVSASSTRAIQKCILRLSNRPTPEEATCWGLGQSQPILMRLLDDHIQFTDIGSQTLLRSQPIQTIKSWAVDDDNNFAFVVEDNQQAQQAQNEQALNYALLSGPAFMCYVFRSLDDDDMSCRVAAKLNEEINKYREQLTTRVSKSTKLKQMIVVDQHQAPPLNQLDDQMTDLDAEDLDEFDELETANELSMNVKYIGKVQVPRPMGIDVLNVAIDKCLAEASNRMISSSTNNITAAATSSSQESPLIDAKLHVSPSSVIVENVETGAIIVECRIRFLTFMGISRRDIRWCGFIMQNTTNKTFVAHCFECYPTAGHVCEAIQTSCSKMYEKMLKGQKTKKQQQQDATTSIMPNGSKIRDTLAKTLSRIKLAPIIQ